MLVMNKNKKISLEAIASGSTPTSGRIIVSLNGSTLEIPAVVFSESEAEKLFSDEI